MKNHAQKNSIAILTLLALGLPQVSFAHVSVISGPVMESTETKTSRAIVRFGIPHGCKFDRSDADEASKDTYKVRILIPEALEGVTIRAVVGSFGGTADLVKDPETGAVKEVIWQRDRLTDEVSASDDYYYSVALRFSIPKGMAFKSLYFPAYQHCIVPGAEEEEDLVSAWVKPASHNHSGHTGDQGDDDDSEFVDDTPNVTRIDSAPRLLILPAHHSGWNKISSGEKHIHGAEELARFFGDAEIIWADDKAFSTNPYTMELIESDPDVTVLDEIHNDTDIWVKY